MIITRKIELYVHADSKDKKDLDWQMLRYLDNTIYKMANDVISHQFLNQNLSSRLLVHNKNYKPLKKEIDIIEENLNSELSKENKTKLLLNKKKLYSKLTILKKEVDERTKDILNTSIQNTTYQVLSDKYSLVHSQIRTCLNSIVQKNYSNDIYDVLSGKKSLATYKKGMPIPFQKPEFKKNKFDIYFTFPGKINFGLHFGKDKSNNKIIVDNIISGKYKSCDSSIQIKDKKIILLLAVDIPENKIKLDKKITVGVDLGINTPAYAALSNNVCGLAIGKRDEFLNVRLRLQKSRRDMQKNLSFTIGGRGRNKKLQALDRYSEKERNFVKTQNHIISRSIIDFAIENSAGVINLEDISGITKDNTFLNRNWSYFELQTNIEYKAKQNGIEVKYINPAYTSQICSFCGHHSSTQRDKERFTCENDNCTNKDKHGNNKTINADYNSARNIAKSTNFQEKGTNKSKKDL